MGDALDFIAFSVACAYDCAFGSVFGFIFVFLLFLAYAFVLLHVTWLGSCFLAHAFTYSLACALLADAYAYAMLKYIYMNSNPLGNWFHFAFLQSLFPAHSKTKCNKENCCKYGRAFHAQRRQGQQSKSIETWKGLDALGRWHTNRLGTPRWTPLDAPSVRNGAYFRYAADHTPEPDRSNCHNAAVASVMGRRAITHIT